MREEGIVKLLGDGECSEVPWLNSTEYSIPSKGGTVISIITIENQCVANIIAVLSEWRVEPGVGGGGHLGSQEG